MGDKQKTPGSKERLRQYLRANIGRVLTSDDLQRASGGAEEFGRRIRELRREEGWPIATHNDRNDLKPGQYIVEAEPPDNYQFSSGISMRLRAQVLERNGYFCQMCGLEAGQPDPERDGKRTILQVGHIIDKSHGGRDILTNLRTLCSKCNQGANNIAQEPPSHSMLLAHVRRAAIHDQQKVLEWLKKRLGEH